MKKIIVMGFFTVCAASDRNQSFYEEPDVPCWPNWGSCCAKICTTLCLGCLECCVAMCEVADDYWSKRHERRLAHVPSLNMVVVEQHPPKN